MTVIESYKSLAILIAALWGLAYFGHHLIRFIAAWWQAGRE